MERIIDEHRVQELLAQGLSERAIAKELQVSRATVKRHREKLQSVPTVYTGTLSQPTTSQDDLTELLEWWRGRKQLTHTSHDPERETERKTYHVEKRYIAAIEQAADLEHVSTPE